VKKLVTSFAVVALLALSVCGSALADTSTPTVTAIDPHSMSNDVGGPVVITGTGFATDGTGAVLPRVTLGSTPLTNVTLVDGSTLNATVPWGMNPGIYPLTVVNPDGGTASLAGAFTMSQGFGQWNGGDLFGGEVRQILLEPNNSSTAYAMAYSVGLFRTRDAGANWTFVCGNVLGNADFVLDPLHSTWLYSAAYNGLQRSTDEGDTWTTVWNHVWPGGGTPLNDEVFPSPYDAQTLFVSSYYDSGFSHADGALGLMKSTDGGTSWNAVSDLNGLSVEDVAFSPSDPTKMVLQTSDARVFQSSDAGDHWTEVAKPAISAIGVRGAIAYNPYTPGEVWIVSNAPNGVFKSTDAALSGWTNVTPADGSGAWDVTFTGADSVWVTGHHTTDGGTSWQRFGPSTADGQLAFDPGDPQVAYLGDGIYGVQKSTDGGLTWNVTSHGLTGMWCHSLDVSTVDPLRVYATFEGWSGVYRSTDGTSNWAFLAIPNSGNVRWVHEDPTDPKRLYAAADSGFYVSTNAGKDWTDEGWNLPPSAVSGMPSAAEDPAQPSHFLVGMSTGNYGTGASYLFTSIDYGVSWQAVTMPQTLAAINSIVFDPAVPGVVYLTTGGTGVYKSTDSGATWQRVDDRTQTDMQNAFGVAIATHQHVVLVGSSNQYAYRSVDGGATWTKAGSSPGGVTGYQFVNGDSTRLYSGTWYGLFSSGNLGDSWTAAAGALGTLHIMALNYAGATDHSIIYGATSGGTGTGPVGGVSAAMKQLRVGATTATMVGAGVYRYVVVTSRLTVTLSGPKGGLRLGTYLTVKGVAAPRVLAGSKVTVRTQFWWHHKWVSATASLRPTASSGAYSWWYKPTKRGSYRLQVTISAAATHTSAATTWHTFVVK
jgi:photosystem II stability/assembly factor-like uncharacterized protein